MDLKLLLKLKDMIVTNEDFSESWDYFFDHFGESRQFMALGKTVKNKLLEAVVEKVAGELYQGSTAVTIVKPRLVKLRKYHFVHGSFFIEGRLGALIFFEDIDMGLMSVTPVSADGPTHFMRFSAYRVGADKAIHLTPHTAKQVN